MIVDDEESIRNITKDFLQEYGYHISAFGNGSDALCEFKKNPVQYDLIISDMTMPKMSGDKLAMEILKTNPDIPVLICTGFSENLSKEKASSIGIRKILNKPLELDDLLIQVRETLDQAKTALKNSLSNEKDRPLP